MNENSSNRIRARATLEILLGQGLEQWQVLQRMRFALASGIIRCRVQFAAVGGEEFLDWDAPRSVWGASIMDSTLSLRLDEYTAQFGATPGHPGKITLSGLSFDLSDLRSFFEIDGMEPSAIVAPAASDGNDRPARGRLPANAKPAERRDEQFAHDAAELVRNGARLSDALRQVAPSDPTRSDASIEHGIRRTYALMYHPDGRVILP